MCVNLAIVFGRNTMYKSNCIHQYKVVPPYLAKLVNIASPSLVLMVINNDYRVNSAYKLASCKLT